MVRSEREAWDWLYSTGSRLLSSQSLMGPTVSNGKLQSALSSLMGAATGQKALTFLWSFLCCHCPQIRFCSPSCRPADPLCSWSSAPGDLPAAPVRSSASTPPQARQERPASPLFREQPVLAPSFLEAGAPFEPCMYALLGFVPIASVPDDSHVSSTPLSQ